MFGESEVVIRDGVEVHSKNLFEKKTLSFKRTVEKVAVRAAVVSVSC